ncbi:unnamed protein product [Ectocarpus sp. 8 AP-2014]
MGIPWIYIAPQAQRNVRRVLSGPTVGEGGKSFTRRSNEQQQTSEPTLILYRSWRGAIGTSAGVHDTRPGVVCGDAYLEFAAISLDVRGATINKLRFVPYGLRSNEDSQVGCTKHETQNMHACSPVHKTNEMAHSVP